MKILTVGNRKGGAGKSTCAAHFAVEAVSCGLKTILIDLDPQKTLEGWWNKRTDENPYLIDSTAEGLDETLEKLKEKSFDLCIIDTPGDASNNAIAGIRVADLVAIPSKPTAPDLSAIGRTISLVEDFKKPFVFIITQGMMRQRATFQASSALSHFSAVAPNVISNRISYAQAMGMGVSATDIDSNTREEIKNVWDFISTRLFEEKKLLKQKLIA